MIQLPAFVRIPTNNISVSKRHSVLRRQMKTIPLHATTNKKNLLILGEIYYSDALKLRRHETNSSNSPRMLAVKRDLIFFVRVRLEREWSAYARKSKNARLPNECSSENHRETQVTSE